MSPIEAPRRFYMNILDAAHFMRTVAEGGWHPVSMQKNRQTGEYKVQLTKRSEATIARTEDGRTVQQAPGLLVGYQVIDGLRVNLFDQIREIVPGSQLDTIRRTLREIDEFVAKQDKPNNNSNILSI